MKTKYKFKVKQDQKLEKNRLNQTLRIWTKLKQRYDKPCDQTSNLTIDYLHSHFKTLLEETPILPNNDGTNEPVYTHDIDLDLPIS